MKTEQSCYSVAEMCLTLGVSRSGLYDHTQKNQRNRRQQDATLAEQIAVIFVQSRNTYGCRRIQQMLRRQGIQCGKNRIRRLMDEQALQAVQKRRFRPPTTQSRSRSTDRSQSIEGASRAATATQSGLDRRHHLHPFSARRLALPG